MLGLLAKQRSVYRLPAELLTQLDNAVCACKPPESLAVRAETRPVLHQYIVELLHHMLDKHSAAVCKLRSGTEGRAAGGREREAGRRVARCGDVRRLGAAWREAT